MDAMFNKYERLPRWLQFIVVILVYVSMYCILSIFSYALYEKAIFHLDRYVDFSTVIRAYTLLQGIGMSVVLLLLIRLILLTYFEGNEISKLKVTLTAVYSQFGIYTFIFFMTYFSRFSEQNFNNLFFVVDALKRWIAYPNFYSETSYHEWLRFENTLSILSITVVIILILQILYLQHSQNINTRSARYWKVVIVLAIVFCAAYMLIISIPPVPIPVTGGGPDNTVIVYITAITGLVSAVSALYSQILAGKKIKMEMEQVTAQKASLAPAKVPKSKAGGKTTKQRKSKQPS
jgi:hypothetical protein